MAAKFLCHVCTGAADASGFCDKHKEQWRTSPEAYRYSHWFSLNRDHAANVALQDFIMRTQAEERNSQ